MNELSSAPHLPEALIRDLRRLISDARRQTAAAVNIGLTLLYWRLGDRIRHEVLGSERAGYGEQIVATLSHELMTEFGRGFERTNLTRMMKFAEGFPHEEIVATLSHQLSWSHFRELLPLDKPLQREFYAEMCRMERSYPSRSNRFHALRANSTVAKAGGTGQTGARYAQGERRGRSGSGPKTPTSSTFWV